MRIRSIDHELVLRLTPDWRRGMRGSAAIAIESSARERATVVLRMATRAFGDGARAAEWLAKPNVVFDGRAPLVFATESMAGCAQVCEYLDGLAGD